MSLIDLSIKSLWSQFNESPEYLDRIRALNDDLLIRFLKSNRLQKLIVTTVELQQDYENSILYVKHNLYVDSFQESLQWAQEKATELIMKKGEDADDLESILKSTIKKHILNLELRDNVLYWKNEKYPLEYESTNYENKKGYVIFDMDIGSPYRIRIYMYTEEVS